MNFFEVLYAQKNGAALPANFFDLLFAKSYTPAAEWGEYDGTLPATYSANGSMLADYRVYGASGGVGDETANIYDWTDMSYGFEGGRTLSADGTTTTNSNWCISPYIEVKPSVAYTINWYVGIPYQSVMCEYDENYNFIGSVLEGLNKTFTTSSQTKYLRLSNTYRNAERSRRENCVLVEGSTAPASYVPYGYEVDMSVSDGTNTTTTPIYIGDDPLENDEYVDYRERKVYRRTVNRVGIFTNLSLNGINYHFNGSELTMSGTARATTGANNDEYKNNFGLFLAAGTYSLEYWNEGEATITINASLYKKDKTLVRASRGNFTLAEDTQCFMGFYVTNGAIINNKMKISIIDGSVAPSTYIPYLQPKDPPVPLPALSTVDGTNIVDYAGQSVAPSRFYAKYQKG